MQVRVLGQVEVIDGQPLALGGPTQRRVLAALVARRGETVSIADLVEVCWPADDQPERAEHNVRTYVHRLRAALGDEGGRIETAGNGYRFTLDADEIDIGRFERDALAARRLFDAGEHFEALDRLTESEALWTGRPYGEFADETWALSDVARLTELHWSTSEYRAEAFLSVGQPANAVSLLERMIRNAPLRERPRSLLMRALYESGRHVEALRAFQEFRRLLVEEIGVEPSSDLINLDQAIASGELGSTSHAARTVGNYELKERIGEGAFAVVHRATQSALGRDVAVKVVRAELANQPEFIRRFEAEAQMVASIEHPNIVPLYDYWREPGQAFLVMRWMTGGSLETRLDSGPITLEETIELIDEIAAALTASHNQGVVHRDVKSANILFDDAGRAYLGDFGIALTTDEQASPQAALSEGSPIFAAPEQLRREPVGPEVDVYALGIVAFDALAGRTPFADAPSQAVLLRQQFDEAIPALSVVRPGLPTQLDRVLGIATAKKSTDRYPTVAGFSSAFRAAAEGIDPAKSQLVVDVERVNPYLGLRAFTETDAATFHGRRRLVDELVGHLAEPDNNLLAIVGPSGSGKSSVVRAGLIPALRAGRVQGSETWFTTTMNPGAHPFEALETALLRIAVNPPASLIAQLREGERGLLRSATRILPDDDGVVVLVVDQFEELFTTAVPAEDRDLFLRSLATAATEPLSRVRIVLTLRADFYDEPLRHSDFAPLIKQHTQVITPLAPDELEEAITLPAASVGVSFEPGLVAEIIADANSQPGALPLLQFALTQAFDRSTEQTISIDDYRSVGGLSGALGRQAESLFLASDESEHAACRRLFGRLVTLSEVNEGTRRRLGRSELPGDEATNLAINRFGTARLLTFDRDAATREPTLEIAHEALIREWPRMRSWLDDDRDAIRSHRHLTAASTGWLERERDANELYRGGRLDAAEPLLTSETVSLNSGERDFLMASLDTRGSEREAQQRRSDRLRRLVAATAVIAVLAIIAGGIAFAQKGRADDQAALAAANAAQAVESAEQAAQRAEESEAATAQADLERIRAVARGTASDNNRLASLLAVEAYRLDPSVESLDVLHRVLTAVPGLQRSIVRDARYFNTALFDDGVTLVAVTRDALEVWDMRDPELVRSVPLPQGSDNVLLALGNEDKLAAVRTHPDQVQLLDPTTGASLGSITTKSDIGGMSFVRDSSQLAIAVADGRVEIWDVSGLEIVTTIDTGLATVSLVAWHQGTDRLAVVSDASVVQYWDIFEDQPIWTSTPEGDLSALTLAPIDGIFGSDGRHFVLDSGFLNGRLRVIDTGDGSLAFPSTARENGSQGDLYWIDEDALIIAAPSLGFLPVYDLTTGESLTPLAVGMSSEDVVYSAELDRVIALGIGGMQVWSVDGAGPLERVVPFSDEQQQALDNNDGTVHAALAADGSRLTVSVFALPDRPATTSFDLTARRNAPGSFSYDDRLVYSNGANTMTFDFTGFQLLDANDEPLGAPIPLTLDMTDQAASADGRFIAIGRSGGFVDLYTGAGELIASLDMRPLSEGDARLVIPSLSDDGHTLAAATEQGAFFVWSTDTLERLDVGRVDNEDNLARGGGRLVGSWIWRFNNGAVQRFDPGTGDKVGEPLLSPPTGFFYPVVDETNGRAAITGGSTVAIYDLESGLQLGKELPYRGIRITYSADGSLLAVPSDDRVTVWNYDTETWADLACELAGANFTEEEWEQIGPRTIDRRATCEQFPLK